MNARTILIGLSRATPGLIQSLRNEGHLGWLKQYADSGVTGHLVFDSPVSDTAAWTSIVTGRTPAHHGVFDLFRRDTVAGHRLRALNSRDVTTESLWMYLHREGLRSTIVEWPLTLPPPRIEGHVVPGSWATTRQLRFACHPSDLARTLTEAGAPRVDDLLINSTCPDPSQSKDEAVAWVEEQSRRENNVLQILHRLAASEPSHLNLVLLRSFGIIGHWYFRHQYLREPITQYLRTVNDAMEALAEALGPQTSFLILSEPGSRTPSRVFPINDWLRDRGDFAWSDSSVKPLEYKVLDTDQLNRQAQRIDWSRTRAWAPLAGQGEIHILRRNAEDPQGVDDEEYAQYRQNLAADLAARTEVQRVWIKEELYPPAMRDFAPDLVVEPKPGYAISPIADNGMISLEEPVGIDNAHGGVFYAKGPLFRSGATAARVRLVDIAPLLCYSFRLPVPAEMEGRVPVEIVDEEQLRSFPVRISQTTEQPAVERVLDPEAEEIVLQRLRSLGYVE